ncbi:SMI1/KNR4 family protein [Marinoscillum pacificum]|uniref:SMI1/KNR4 family protein n=1 Tax=Marinoscillum pacificum TaxID=392723 RepID=UPI0021587C5C|nr:SMI1/KNR4 family protein [Marinoscillum pacificum]
MKAILDKIKSFGFIQKHSYSESDEKAVRNIFKQMNGSIPSDYLYFMKELGSGYIDASVKVHSKTDIPPVNEESKYLSISRFLDWSETSDFSIHSEMHMLSDQLPNRFIPFVEGASGDFYGFSIRKDGTYFISYWHHESILNEQIHLVADDFNSFIMSITEYKEKHSTSVSSNDSINHNSSPKMIELLKRTGKWKGD